MAKPRLCDGGVTLRDQINKRWPNRDKASDGWIGDSRHQANKGWGTNGKGSYHNPDPNGIVHAIDVDEDFLGKGKGQKEAKRFAEELAAYCREGKDGGRIAHIVYEDQVASGTSQNWKFRGSGYGHTHHIHISFTNKADSNGAKFDLPIFKENNPAPQPPAPPKPNVVPTFPGVEKLSFGQFNSDIKKMQDQLIKKGFKIPAGATGNYKSETVTAVRSFNKSIGITSDGKKMGPKAWSALWSDK
jgi:hypothetical protein